MKKNVGGLDRALRILLGVLIGAAGYYYSSWWGLLALPLIVTGLFSRCGLYYPLGISTCKVEEPPKQEEKK